MHLHSTFSPIITFIAAFLVSLKCLSEGIQFFHYCKNDLLAPDLQSSPSSPLSVSQSPSKYQHLLDINSVLWCGASAWHRPTPRGKKSHRPAPTLQAGAKISSPRPNAPGRKKCSGALKRPGAQKTPLCLTLTHILFYKTNEKRNY